MQMHTGSFWKDISVIINNNKFIVNFSKTSVN
jgi:hypothetical protein